MQLYIGSGSTNRILPEIEVEAILSQAFDRWALACQRVLVLIPDGTRTAPVDLMFERINGLLHDKVSKLDYLIALGTHPPMDEQAVEALIGCSRTERERRFPKTEVFNHSWNKPEELITLGTITAEEIRHISDGLLDQELPVSVNRRIMDYDVVIVCGPVFPHEVVGFSGGNKYFFPGISGSEVIDMTHWLGALKTSYDIIGTKSTPVRDLIDKATGLIPIQKRYCCMVTSSNGLLGLFCSEGPQAWEVAANLSSQTHVRYVDQSYKKVLAILPEMYDDLWTGAKGMYKLEPVIADGGELILYAPHIDQVSITHGQILEKIGYHIRDYFLENWDNYRHFPWGVLAHSTHLKGKGVMIGAQEQPRIKVSLATGISELICERINLGYISPDEIIVTDWMNRENEGILVVEHAGEMLYRLNNQNRR